MKLLLAFLCLQLLAQTPAPAPAGQSTKTPDAPAATAPAQDTKAADVPSPAPTEDWLKGSIELGYRWVPSIAGSESTYRSIVNLGQGPKLFNADFTILSPNHKYFDRADVRASSWGDPYNTLRVDVRKESSYRLSVDYRNIAYFNFLPSYADPTLLRGNPLDWNSFDTRIRTANVQLDLFPGRKIQPYLAFSSNSQSGRGVSVFYGNTDEFPVATSLSDSTKLYRAGLQIDIWRGHLTLEEGGTTFKDDQGESNATANTGDVLTAPTLGQQLTLQNLGLGYNVRGHSYYSKGVLALNPTTWMTLSGDFTFSQPVTNTKYTDAASGTLYAPALLQLIGGQTDLLTADASMPHTSGSFNVELRPFRRVRIVSYWLTDRLHNAAGALLTQALLAGATTTNLSTLSSDRMVENYNQEEVDVYYDLSKHLTLRGGYRYVWGDSLVRAELQTIPFESGNLKRHVGIGGVTYRLGQKLRLVGDFEASQADQVYYRTSLRNYQKAHLRGSYDLFQNLRLSADFTLLNNSDPDPQVRNDFRSRAESLSAFWTPKSGTKFSLLVDYTRSSVYSNILYLVPQTLTPSFSNYVDNAHTGTALASYRWFSLGGSFLVSSGSRPTQYYQPVARVSVPLRKNIAWNAEWRWYGFTERFYGYENFNSNQFMTSLRFSR